MNIDEKKIEELIEKEIKEQVANKLKLVGRKALLNIIEDSATVAIKEILDGEIDAIRTNLEKEFIENKKQISESITNDIADRFMQTIIDALKKEVDYELEY